MKFAKKYKYVWDDGTKNMDRLTYNILTYWHYMSVRNTKRWWNEEHWEDKYKITWEVEKINNSDVIEDIENQEEMNDKKIVDICEK